MPKSDHARVADAIATLTSSWRAPPHLHALAARAELSPHHFQRTFRRLVGVSPKRFTQALAADLADRMLTGARPLHEVQHAAGLSSAGRLHDLVVSVSAMSPGELRRGGEGLVIRYGVHAGPLGEVVIAETPRGVCALELVPAGAAIDAHARAVLARRWPRATVIADREAGRAVAAQLLAARARPGPLSLHVAGTNFQIRVWSALLAIPRGSITTYGAIADAIGAPGSARAVGGAVGANPVAVLIPCHRVLRMNGVLGGYRWGLPHKRALLALEA